jgi:Na+/proline symporter
VHRRATAGVDSFFLGNRGMPWWLLGMAGCSSYIDISNTMAAIGILFYLGLQGVWFLHITWGWFILCFYMAYQGKYIRRSGVSTFAEWNRTRFGDGPDTDRARLTAAVFLLVLMVCNLMTIAVGIGKFAETLLGMSPSLARILVFGVVAIYTTLGGFFGVVLTDALQTCLVAIGAVVMAVIVWTGADPAGVFKAKAAAWNSLSPVWNLWDGYAASVPDAYQRYQAIGPLLLGSGAWLVFRVLAGPNVWDFQFFLTARSARDAALAGGAWTIGYTLRWMLCVGFLVLGLQQLQSKGQAAAITDGETLMPAVLNGLQSGLRGLFVALLLAALMSTLNAMVNVTSSVVTNDFVDRYFARSLSARGKVRVGQVASIGALVLAFFCSFGFDNVKDAWEVMIFVVVTAILVPATMRWHWWRFSARAFTIGLTATAVILLAIAIADKAHWIAWSDAVKLPVATGASLLLCLILGFALPPAPADVLVRFYANVRPFGVWGPVRRQAVAAGLVPVRDPLPWLDAINGVLTMVLQVALCLDAFYALLWRWSDAGISLTVTAAVGVILWFTWYRALPARDEKPVV